MTRSHRRVLTGALLLLGLSLFLPGVLQLLDPQTGTSWLIAENRDALNHLRALNGMMASIGLISLWACWRLQYSRQLVMILGWLMLALVASRLCAIALDGLPGFMTWFYLMVEGVLMGLFLFWPPRAS
jgi:hypothetical protein